MDDTSTDDCQLVETSSCSISCTNIPDAFLDKFVAKKHFGQYGRIRNFTLRPSKGTCTVEYETPDSAEDAVLDAGSYKGETFDVMYTTKEFTQPIPLDDDMDQDVQNELEAMGSTQRATKTSSASVGSFGGMRSTTGGGETSTDLRQMKLAKTSQTAHDTTPAIVNSSSMTSQISASSVNAANAFGGLRSAMGDVETRPRYDIRQVKMTKATQPAQEAASAAASPTVNLAAIDRSTRAELEAILRKVAVNSEEKYAVLDARDKFIRLTTARQTDISRATSTKGSCPDMCPEKERLMREAKHQVAIFEERSRGVINHNLAVKQYSRSSADQETPLPHELRPEPVLKMTMNYLLHSIMDLCDDAEVSISDWFHFVWDRTRSIRKDITQQEMCSPGSVLFVEQCARFHIHCAARLIAEEPQVFDQKINTENLTKCLQSLKYMYHDLALKMIRCPNEAEFRAYVVLMNLNDSNFLWEVKQLPADILHSPEIRYALSVYMAMETNNYVKFFSLVRATTYMNACILLRYFTQVRVKALSIMLKSYVPSRPVAMSISHLTYILAFEDFDQCALFLEYYGLACERNDDRVLFDRGTFYYPDMPFILDRAINVIEHKRHTTVGEAVHGAPLDSPDDFQKHQPQNSFDSNGYLSDLSLLLRLEDDVRMKRGKARVIQDAPKGDIMFKIPSALPPRQASPKGMETPPRTPGHKLGDPPKAKPGQWAFNANAAAPPAPENIFKQGKLFEGSAATGGQKNSSFSLASVVPINKPASSSDVTDSKNNLFKNAVAVNSGFGAETDNKFSLRHGNKQQQDASNANEFSLSLNKPPSANIFGNTGVKPAQSSIFGDFGDKQRTPIQKSTFGGSSNTNTNTNTNNGIFSATEPASNNLFGAASNLASQSVSLPSTFAGFKMPTVQGISKLSTEGDRDQLAVGTQRQNSETARKIAEEERQQAAKRQMEEERERKRAEADALRAKQEQIARVEMVSTNVCTQILDEYLKSICADLAVAELKRYEAFEQKTQNLHAALINETVAELLLEITNDIVVANQNIMRKYFTLWQRKAIERIENRRKIESTPIWMPMKSIPEQIPELQHPQQTSTLSCMKRYRMGVPFNIKVPAIKEPSIDLWKVATPDILCAMARHQRQSTTKSHIYWKCVISVPDATEDNNFESINRWLSRIFVRQQARRKDIFFLEQCTVSEANNHRVSICLRKLSGPELTNESGKQHCAEAIRGTNAVLFFAASENFKLAKCRLATVIQSTGIKTAIGIVTYNSSTIDSTILQNELGMQTFLTADTIERCLFVDRGHDSLAHLTIKCMQYIATNSQFDYRLELQRITSFLQLTLGDELWKRITSTLNQNPTLDRAITDFNFVANFHNEALRRVTSICNHSMHDHWQFADEFRPFVPDVQLDIPLTVEYFPIDWTTKHEQHQRQLIKFLQSLELKEFHTAEIPDVSSLEQNVLMYARQHIANEREASQAAYKMLQPILHYLNQEIDDDSVLTFQQKLSYYPWVKSIEFFSLDVLTHRYNNNIHKQSLPGYVIYDKDDLAAYIGTPWWLTLKKTLLKEITTDVLNDSVHSHDGEPDGSPSIKKRRMDDSSMSSHSSQLSLSPFIGSPGIENQKIDIDEVLDRGRATLERVDKKIAAYNRFNHISKEVSKDFDNTLYKQEQTIRVMKNIWKNNLQE